MPVARFSFLFLGLRSAIASGIVVCGALWGLPIIGGAWRLWEVNLSWVSRVERPGRYAPAFPLVELFVNGVL